MRALFTCDSFEVKGVKDKISKEQFCNKYGKVKDSLYRYAVYRLGNPDDAEDAVSDAVLSAWKDIDNLRDEDAFSSWIFAILRNICNAKIKALIRQREKIEKAGISEKINSEAASHDDAPLPLELREALGILSDEEKDVVLMSVVFGFTSNEISEISGLTPGSVRSKLSRSLSKMREFLS